MFKRASTYTYFWALIDKIQCILGQSAIGQSAIGKTPGHTIHSYKISCSLQKLRSSVPVSAGSAESAPEYP